MRKQTKWAAILGAAAVMTFGACMTSFAATGWVDDGDAWYWYDSNGDTVESTWKKGADGKSYYLGSDGQMVTEAWVEADSGDAKYYVNAYGARVTNEWRFMYGMDDDADEESWFWFDANGKMAASKKAAVNGKTYYFDNNGKMLTGWVNVDDYDETDTISSDVVYCDEDGARVTGWAELYEPGDEDEEDLYWYNFSSKGEPRINKKQTINNKIYLFDGEGRMISGWAYYGTASGSSAYYSIEDDTRSSDINWTQMYYCGGSSDGSMKKSTWVKTVEPTLDEGDTDEDRNWYYMGTNGVLYIASSADIGEQLVAQEYKTTNYVAMKDPETIGIRKVGTKTYGFKQNGIMVKGLWYVTNDYTNFNEGTYYFGASSDGALKTGSATLKDDYDDTYSYYFSTKGDGSYSKGQGITGAQSSKLYKDGLLVKADEGMKYEYKVVDNAIYLINESGKIMTGTGYKDDNDDRYSWITLTSANATGAASSAYVSANGKVLVKVGDYDSDTKKTNYNAAVISGGNVVWSASFQQ